MCRDSLKSVHTQSYTAKVKLYRFSLLPFEIHMHLIKYLYCKNTVWYTVGIHGICVRLGVIELSTVLSKSSSTNVVPNPVFLVFCISYPFWQLWYPASLSAWSYLSLVIVLFSVYLFCKAICRATDISISTVVIFNTRVSCRLVWNVIANNDAWSTVSLGPFRKCKFSSVH